MSTAATPEKGLFTLRTAADLRLKLNHDYQRMLAAPTDSYAALDFFVTAEHMLDWIHPMKAGEKTRTKAKKESVLLQICSHIANGAKHFEVEDKRHHSVTATALTRGKPRPQQYVGSSIRTSNMRFPGRLIVRLSGTAKADFGDSIAAPDLALRLIQFWEQHPDVPNT